MNNNGKIMEDFKIKEQLYNMKLFERKLIDCIGTNVEIYIVRVPGGWVYEYSTINGDFCGNSCAFIPFTNKI